MALRVAVLLCLAAVATATGPFLGTDKNFDKDVLNSGKNVFVKFLAHWDKLGKAYADSDSVLIVDVDCTADGQGTCGKMGVKGYPTIKYFVGGDKKGKDYQGGRDFNSLKSFVETKLNKPMCDVETKKGCKPNEITFIEKHQDMSASELMDVLKQKAQELVKVKKDKSEAEKEFKAKEKELKKEEVKIQTATNLLRQLEKVAAKKAKSEL